MLGLLCTFIDDFILLINKQPTECRVLIAGNFNLDQMLSDNVAKVDPLNKNFNLSLCWQHSTRMHAGSLDLVFGTSNASVVSSLPSP